MKNLFIDSNVWLSLYHFTNDDLAQFGKLKEILGQDIKLYIPKQVYDEVLRNREAKLKDAFNALKSKVFNILRSARSMTSMRNLMLTILT